MKQGGVITIALFLMLFLGAGVVCAQGTVEANTNSISTMCKDGVCTTTTIRNGVETTETRPWNGEPVVSILDNTVSNVGDAGVNAAEQTEVQDANTENARVDLGDIQNAAEERRAQITDFQQGLRDLMAEFQTNLRALIDEFTAGIQDGNFDAGEFSSGLSELISNFGDAMSELFAGRFGDIGGFGGGRQRDAADEAPEIAQEGDQAEVAEVDDNADVEQVETGEQQETQNADLQEQGAQRVGENQGRQGRHSEIKAIFDEFRDSMKQLRVEFKEKIKDLEPGSEEYKEAIKEFFSAMRDLFKDFRDQMKELHGSFGQQRHEWQNRHEFGDRDGEEADAGEQADDANEDNAGLEQDDQGEQVVDQNDDANEDNAGLEQDDQEDLAGDAGQFRGLGEQIRTLVQEFVQNIQDVIGDMQAGNIEAQELGSQMQTLAQDFHDGLMEIIDGARPQAGLDAAQLRQNIGEIDQLVGQADRGGFEPSDGIREMMGELNKLVGQADRLGFEHIGGDLDQLVGQADRLGFEHIGGDLDQLAGPADRLGFEHIGGDLDQLVGQADSETNAEATFATFPRLGADNAEGITRGGDLLEFRGDTMRQRSLNR